MNRIGGSPKMATDPALRSIAATTAAMSIETAETKNSSSGQENILFSEQTNATQCSFGASSLMTPDRLELTAPSLGTKARSGRHSLSNRLMRSLIIAGLVKGITPTSIRKNSGAKILVIASWSRDGGDVA